MKMKLASYMLRAEDRDDVVCKRALEMRITPEEVFARAFLDVGLTRSEAATPFRKYCTKQGSDHIPESVLEYCAKPLPRCANPACADPKKVASFTRMNAANRPTYFCSLVCMQATPKDTRREEEILSAAGIVILERVRVAVAAATYITVAPHLIRPLKGQPRVYFNPDRQARLVRSLKQVGQMMPGMIRKIPQDTNGAEYELLDGERRHRGVVEAGLPTYRAMLIEIDDEAAPYVVSVISNFNREDHTVLEVADAVQNMHEHLHLTHAQIAEVIGTNPVEVSKLYGLRRLIPEVRDMIDPHKVKGHPLPKGAAVEISQQPQEHQLALAQKMLNRELTLSGLKARVRESAGGGPKKRPGPRERREIVVTRVRMVANATEGLSQALNEPGMDVILHSLPELIIGDLSTQLEAAREQLVSNHKRLKKLLS